MIEKGKEDPEEVIFLMRDLINKEPLAKIDYVALVDPLTFERVSQIKENVLIALAVRIGKVRLIDNIRIK